MLMKSADNKQPQIDALEALLARPDLNTSARRKIQDEIRTIRAGEKAERDAAYDIEFYYADNRNCMTIHDLRIVCDGRVAQIDHLIINRFFEIWVCESKSFAEGVAINQRGEWSSYHRGQEQGIKSPIEQNKRHIAVLTDVFEKRVVKLPKRFGVTLKPALKSLILVSNTAWITRPQGLDTVIKSEQLETTITRELDKKGLGAIPKVVGRETVTNLARQLVALHTPASFNWAAKFGLPGEPPPTTKPTKPVAPVVINVDPHRHVCDSCGRNVSDKVVGYCRANRARLGDGIYCFDCQRKF